MKKKTISLIVNARKKSTRVKNKLLRNFYNKKSLIEICLNKINNLNYFDNIFLAAAEKDFFQIAKKYKNIKILHRSTDAVKKGVNSQAKTFEHYNKVTTDYIFILNPCLPMISLNTIKKAYDYVQKTNFSSYTSVCLTRDWIFDEKGEALTNKNPKSLTTNQGSFYYKAAHAFHILDVRKFKRSKLHWTFTKNDPHLFQIPENEVIDVDTENEFSLAKIIYKEKLKND
jgi:CMP-N-acetylneuraminic acid synthetase